MKKLTGALVLSLSLLLTSACRSAGETRDPEDASTPATDAQPPTSSGALREDTSALQNDAGAPPPNDAGPGAPSDIVTGGKVQPPSVPADKSSAGGSYCATLTPAEKQAQESCLDKWLQGKKLDQYGSPEGTMYAGGTPLFDERTGERRERLDFVYERHPDAKKACATAATQNVKGIPGKKK